MHFLKQSKQEKDTYNNIINIENFNSNPTIEALTLLSEHNMEFWKAKILVSHYILTPCFKRLLVQQPQDKEKYSVLRQTQVTGKKDCIYSKQHTFITRNHRNCRHFFPRKTQTLHIVHIRLTVKTITITDSFYSWESLPKTSYNGTLEHKDTDLTSVKHTIISIQ